MNTNLINLIFFTNLKGNNNGNKTSEKCYTGKSTKEVDEWNDKQQHQCSICLREFESVLLSNEHYIVCKKTLLAGAASNHEFKLLLTISFLNDVLGLEL